VVLDEGCNPVLIRLHDEVPSPGSNPGPLTHFVRTQHVVQYGIKPEKMDDHMNEKRTGNYGVTFTSGIGINRVGFKSLP
jgi:hypothetical protein